MKKRSNKTAILFIRLTPAERERAERIAQRRNTTVSQLIRDLLHAAPNVA